MKKLVSFIKENRTGFKAISMILVLALMVQTVSIAVTAISESGLSIDEMFSIDDSSETMPSIVGEVEGNRDRYTKVYELADGSFYEVVSNKPIHENVGGQWEEPANNLDIPESVDEVTSYCNELADSISEGQNNGRISTLSYIEDGSEENITDKAYIIERSNGCRSEYSDLDLYTYMLLNLNDERLSLSNTNQLLINQSLHIKYGEKDFLGNNPRMLVNVILEDWYIDENGQVYDSNGSPLNTNNKLQVDNSIIGTDLIFNSGDTECEFDITEISHRWNKGIVENNGLYVSLSGEYCWAEIIDCYLTRRYLIIDAYDQDLTYHTIDMGYAGQVLVNDLTNTITVLRNEMYYPTENMPINLYRYFDFSKTYTDLNPAGIGTHWNYESPITAEDLDRIAWSAFDGRTIRFEPSAEGSNIWSDKNGEGYTLYINNADITTAYYDSITINSLDGLTYTFGSAGKIKRIDDNNNNFIEVKYHNETIQDYIIIIENNSGYRYEFTYNVISNDTEEINTLSKISYQKKNSDESEAYETICINGAPVEISYEYITLPGGKVALSKVTYPHDSETPECDWLTVEYLYDNGRLVGIVDIDKRKLKISYTGDVPDYINLTTNPNATKSVDNYPSVFSLEEFVVNNAYTDDMPDDQKYLSVPKSSLKIDRTNTYHRVFENESEELETLHYSKEFQLLYYTNNDGNDYYADYKSANGKHYVSQIVSPEKPLEESAKKLGNENFNDDINENITDNPFHPWSVSGAEIVTDANRPDNKYARITGSVDLSNYMAQTAIIDGHAGDIFVVGGYAMSKDASTNKEQFFGIEVYEIVIGRKNQEVPGDLLYTLTFDPTMDNVVQYRLGAFKLNKDINKVYYKIMYSHQTGEAKFDDLLLYKSSEKNVDFFDAPVTVNSNIDTESISTPSTPSDPTIGDGNDDYSENYFSIESTDQNNITTIFDYNRNTGFLAQKRVETGNKSTDTGDDSSADTGDDSSADTSNDPKTSYMVDQYSYDAMGALTEVKRVFEMIDPNSTTPQKIIIENITNYEYKYGKISSVIHNNMTYQFNYNSYGDLDNITFVSNSTEEIPLISYDYTDDAHRYVNKITYSNGKVLGYSYDDNGRITAISDCSGTLSKMLFSYSYDITENTAENITEIKDHTTRRVLRRSDNLYQIYELAENSDSLDDAELLYSKVTSKNDSGTIDETISALSFNYLKTTNAPIYNSDSKTTSYSSSTTMNIGYSIKVDTQAACDYFGRITSSSVTVKEQDVQNSDDYVIKHSIENERTYLKNADGTSTSSLLETYSTTIRNEEADSTDDKEIFDLSCIYSYDKAGRITHIFYKYNNHRKDYDNSDNNENEIILKYYYEYDDAGQLVKEADYFEQTYIEYSYDSNGNITRKIVYSASDTYIGETDGKVYLKKVIKPGTELDPEPQEENPTPINDILYEYYSNYPDTLKSYGGKDITADEFGNPGKYHRIDGSKKDTFILEWEGNQLQTVRPEGDDSLYEYKYDDEGRRIQKIIYCDYDPNNPANKKPEMIMDYIWDDNRIMGYRVSLPSETTSITIDAAIIYDELDNPVGLKYCTTGLTDGENDSDLSNEDVFWFIKDGQGNVMALYSEISNYRIGCDLNSEGKLEINDTNNFSEELNQRIEEADDFRSGLLIALSTVLAIHFSTMISTDATQTVNNSSIMDIETGLYYCQNKYYSPEYGRFINVGNVEEIVYELENPFNSNPFVYCNNNPINHRETSMKSKSSSTAVGIQAELSKSIFSFSDSVGIEFVYEPVKDELFAYYYSDAKSNIDYTQKAVEHINNVLGSIPFSATTSLKGLASNFKINNSLSLSYFCVQHDKNFVWPNSYQNTARVTAKKINGYRGYTVYGNGYNLKGVCFYPTTNVGFAFNDLTAKYTKLEVNFPALKNYLATNHNNIIETIK